MKKLIAPFAAVVLLAACNNAPEADKATTTDKQEVKTAEGAAYMTDSTSTVTWTGTKPGGSHAGTFKVKEGSLAAKDGSLTGGSFVIDV